MFEKNKLDINISKMTILWPSEVLLRENPIILWGLSWAHEIAHEFLKTNIFARFFCLIILRTLTQNFTCIFYCPSVKWLAAGPLLVMRAIMAPPCV